MSADALIARFEQEKSRALGRSRRRDAGLYYTPPQIAARVVEVALRHGVATPGDANRGSGADPVSIRVLDPCAGAGAFLVAAARAGLRDLHGLDLDPDALRVARQALRLCGASASLRRADALRHSPGRPADLVVSNPPYGHVSDARERAFLLRTFPALRGGEIDRYAAFLLRALQLVRPGGAAALLVPDTWMFLARAGALREAILAQAEVAAIVDLGKPFASAKDTRVHAVVMVRRPSPARPTFVARGASPLAPAAREELAAAARRGWFVYRSRDERDLCAAMEEASVPLGSACAVGYGMRTGANARHVARREPRALEVGLVGGEDVLPYALRWRPKALLHPEPLQALVRRQLGAPRVAVQRIRTNAQAPWARWLEAAMVPADRVCLDSLSTLACADEERLWALLALVQSVALQRHHRLRTTDVNVKPSALRELPVPRPLLESPEELAGLARLRAVAAGSPAAHGLDRRIDACVYRAFSLSPRLVRAAEHGFWAERFDEEFRVLEQAMSDPSATVAGQEEIA
ncbi:MAG TPA: N-6 DNA methylase [Myxococcales bacterium]|nr:N-6 DNA methylase [Myxococcales bacterium]